LTSEGIDVRRGQNSPQRRVKKGKRGRLRYGSRDKPVRYSAAVTPTKAVFPLVFVAWLPIVACDSPRPVAPSGAQSATAHPVLPGRGQDPVATMDAADSLHRSAIVVDTHNDVTQRLIVEGVNLGDRLPDGHTDIPRMREGGLDAEFLSVFVPPMLYPGRGPTPNPSSSSTPSTRSSRRIRAPQYSRERRQQSARPSREARSHF